MFVYEGAFFVYGGRRGQGDYTGGGADKAEGYIFRSHASGRGVPYAETGGAVLLY